MNTVNSDGLEKLPGHGDFKQFIRELLQICHTIVMYGDI